MRTKFLCISVLRVASGPRLKLDGCKSAIIPRWFTCCPFEGGGSGVGLTLCCFVVYSVRLFVLCLILCYFVTVFSVHFVRLLDLHLFGFVCFLFLLVAERAAVCNCGTSWTFLLPFFT